MMQRIADIAAQALSILLYPLFVPTYGVALFCYAFHTQVVPLPAVWVFIAILGTLLLTCILPITAIWILIRRGEVKDLEIANAGERTMPYIYSIMGFGFWCYLMIAILEVPLSIRYVALGATLALAVIAFVNRYWKISAHLTGLGGLIGGIMSYCLGISAIPTWGTYVLWLCISLVLMYARVRLKAHTPAQVCAGWLLGICFTFIPYCIYTYVA